MWWIAPTSLLDVKNLPVNLPLVSVLYQIDLNALQQIVPGMSGLHGQNVLLPVELENIQELDPSTKQLVMVGLNVIQTPPMKANHVIPNAVLLIVDGKDGVTSVIVPNPVEQVNKPESESWSLLSVVVLNAMKPSLVKPLIVIPNAAQWIAYSKIGQNGVPVHVTPPLSSEIEQNLHLPVVVENVTKQLKNIKTARQPIALLHVKENGPNGAPVLVMAHPPNPLKLDSSI